jgi:hypothetical protein
MQTNWTRLSELPHLDAIGTDVVLRVAKELQRFVPGLFDSVALKVARAMVERTISPTRIGEIVDATVKKHRAGTLRAPAYGYFTAACKREWAKAGVPWDDGGPTS